VYAGADPGAKKKRKVSKAAGEKRGAGSRTPVSRDVGPLPRKKKKERIALSPVNEVLRPAAEKARSKKGGGKKGDVSVIDLILGRKGEKGVTRESV